MWSALAGAALGFLGGERRNQAQMEQADAANAFSAQQFATRYQTTTADMMAAGLNPMLAYSQGGGAPPSGQQANISENSLGNAASGYQAMSLNRSQVALLKAQTSAAEAQAEKTRAETPQVQPLAQADIDLKHSSAGQARASIEFMRKQGDKVVEETKNVPKEGNRLDALVRNLDAVTRLTHFQQLTEQQRTIQMRALAQRTWYEADLTEKDLDAAIASGNFGRLSHEFRYVVEVLGSVVPNIGRLFKNYSNTTRSNTTRYDRNGNVSGGSSTESIRE